MQFKNIPGEYDLETLDNDNYLYKPNNTKNISDVLPAAINQLYPWNKPFNTNLDIPKDKEHDIIINILIDSLGSWQVDELCSKSAPMRKFFATPGMINSHLSCVFPTITSTCIVSYNTGLLPAHHGILNQKIYMKEIDATIDTLSLRTTNKPVYGVNEPLHGSGINVSSWMLNSPRVYPSLDEKTEIIHIMPWMIRGTGLSRFYRMNTPNEHYLGRGTVFSAFGLADRLVRNQSGKKSIINIYFGEIDHASHEYGPISEFYMYELENIVKGVSWLINKTSGSRSRIFYTITADHGQVDLIQDQYHKIMIKSTDFIFAERVFTSGRVIQFHARDGKVEELKNELVSFFAGKGTVISGNTILELTGLFSRDKGDSGFSDTIFSRLGDVLVLLHDGFSVMIEKDNKPFKREKKRLIDFQFVGNHGSLTDKELIVPLIAGSSNDLQERLSG